MAYPVTPLTIIYLLVCLLTIAALAMVWLRRGAPGWGTFFLLAVAGGEWLFFSALEASAPTLAQRVVFAKFEYFGISSLGVFWLLFSLQYTQNSRFSRLHPRVLVGMFIVPAVTVVLAFTNESHHLLWTSITELSSGPGAPTIYAHGPAFWLINIYTDLFVLVGTVILVRSIYRFPRIYRRQAAALLVGLAIPWIGNIIYVAGLSPLPGLDLTPIGFSISGLIYAWTLYGLRLFDLTPVARDLLLESMYEGVLVLDQQDRVVEANPRIIQMLRSEKRLPPGLPLEKALSGWPDLAAALSLSPQAPAEFELDNLSGNSLDIHVTPIFLRDGRFGGRLVTLQDITERKRLETLRDDMIHTIVHDLRNPLSNIRLALPLIEKNMQPSNNFNAQEFLDILNSSAGRMTTMVNTILEANRLESGQMPLELKTVSLTDLVAEALEFEQPQARSRRVQIDSSLSPDLSPVVADRTLILRVVLNLLDNAMMVSPEESNVELEASCTPDGLGVKVCVRDQGAGISPEVRLRLFEKYASGRKNERGIGLGLAFCRMVIEAHGGRIWAEDAPGGGAIFFFTLPAATL